MNEHVEAVRQMARGKIADLGKFIDMLEQLALAPVPGWVPAVPPEKLPREIKQDGKTYTRIAPARKRNDGLKSPKPGTMADRIARFLQGKPAQIELKEITSATGCSSGVAITSLRAAGACKVSRGVYENPFSGQPKRTDGQNLADDYEKKKEALLGKSKGKDMTE